ncbi:MAG: glycosyltransferase family 2 protein [Schleiferiaceae bacterium]|nr:glycosyltransferase family 2 protein [Schleiferiaceae bacterium]
MNTPFFSVVLTVFNGEKTLLPCLQSVLNQSFQNIEILVINDGSTDKTKRILETITDARLTCVHRENRGIWASRNEAIARAKAPFIANIDADDTWLTEKLEKQFQYLQQHPDCVLLGTFTHILDHFGQYVYFEKKRTEHKDLQRALQKGNQFTNSSVVFSKQAFAAVGGYPAKLKSGFEDYLLFVKLADYGQVANLAEGLVNYRVSFQSVTLRKESPEFTRIKMDCIAKKDISETDAQALVAIAKSQRESIRLRKSGYHFFLGRAFLFYNFNRGKAFFEFTKSLGLHPWHLKSWIYFVMTIGFPKSLIDYFYNRQFGQKEFIK